jgi:hypothetical protein
MAYFAGKCHPGTRAFHLSKIMILGKTGSPENHFVNNLIVYVLQARKRLLVQPMAW